MRVSLETLRFGSTAHCASAQGTLGVSWLGGRDRWRSAPDPEAIIYDDPGQKSTVVQESATLPSNLRVDSNFDYAENALFSFGGSFLWC